jgi:hypothetical protein
MVINKVKQGMWGGGGGGGGTGLLPDLSVFSTFSEQLMN